MPPVARTETGKHPTGWVKNLAYVDEVLGALRHPIFGVTADPIKDSGKGKVALLYKALTALNNGVFPIHEQGTGDCVSHGWGLGVDIVKAVQIAAGAREQFTGETVTEGIYAASRVEIGKGRLGRGAGSIGAWAAQAVAEYGTLVRNKYGDHDLSSYSARRADQWGMPRAGLPDELEPTSREHPIKTTSLVQSYEEIRDSIFNGYPVPICSNRGFSSKRDAKGFAQPSGSWAHCMLACGIDDEDARPGVLIVNSWGPNWISGPLRHEQPEGSFWCDAQVVAKMLAENDSFAMSGYVGFPAQDLDFSGL